MKKTQNQTEEKDIIFRKCDAIFIFWWILSLIVLIILIVCFFNSKIDSWLKSSILEFLLLLELIIVICLFETYMSILVVWKNGVRLENWIIFTHKNEIPYNKINNVKMHSIFWFATLEIYTGNDNVNRYKFLNNYEEAEKLIKEHMTKNT